MNRQALMVIIGITLIGFILFKGAASFLCEPTKANSVANVISSVAPSSEPVNINSKPDPLSWTPLLSRMANLFSKACPQ